MSEFHVEVVRVGPVEKHANADTLSITHVREYPVILRTGDFKEGDLAVYVPVDSVVPADDPRWAFLQGRARIKAKKLRSVFSMGLLTKAEPGMIEGQDVREQLRITKYEPPEPLSTGGDNEACPFDFPKYTDIEGFRRWPDVLKDGEWVVVTEKIHGTNARFVFHDGRLWVGSHTCVKKDSPESAYWKAARQYNLAVRLGECPDHVIFGEVYGWVQSLRYGHSTGKVSLALFDVLSLKTKKYLDELEFERFASRIGLPAVPKLYFGPFDKDILKLAEGKTFLAGDHVREGIVIRPVMERLDDRIGRVILKHVGEGYLLA